MMINYLIEFGILYAFCGICYLLIRQHAGYKTLRAFINSALGLSLLLPIMPQIKSSSVETFSVLLPEAFIAASGQSLSDSLPAATSYLTITNVLLSIYFICTLFFLLKFLHALIKLVSIILREETTYIDGKKVIISPEINNPCSFFNYILLPSAYAMDDKETKVVIEHETYHIKFWHSFEKIMFELFNILIWWHPAHFMFRKQLSLIHEYQVDDAMMQHVQPNIYKGILLQLIINPPGLRMTNPFSSNIKKRIKMMNKQKRNLSSPVVTILSIAMFMSMLSIHACTKDDSTSKVKLKAKKQVEQEKFYMSETIDTIVTFDADTYEETVDIVRSDMKVYNTPDVMPVFEGCSSDDEDCSSQNLLKFVYSNITYPEEARKNDIEGMIVVKFVVNDRGVIQDYEFIKTLEYGLEASVKKMLDKMQKEVIWTPGKEGDKHVNVAFTLPVKFKLQ